MTDILGGYSLIEIAGFFVLVVISLFVDLHAHSKDKPVTVKSAGLWTLFWIAVALAFGGYIWFKHGQNDASMFLTGYVLEKSLSVDNLFVMMAIFANFAIKDKFQHRVLYFGILGAIIFRLIFILAGTAFVHLLGWIASIIFAAFIIWSAWKMWESMNSGEEDIEDYSNHWSVKFTKKFLPVHNKLEGHDFFKRIDGRLFATPLLMCLIVIEVADIMFAFDSVPAVIAVTQNLFLVYTSNIFAILGLRSMYFMLAAAKNMLCHLEKAVVAILAFIGIKMLIQGLAEMHAKGIVSFDASFLQPSPTLSLFIVLGLLVAGIAASVIWPEKSGDDSSLKTGSDDDCNESDEETETKAE